MHHRRMPEREVECRRGSVYQHNVRFDTRETTVRHHKQTPRLTTTQSAQEEQRAKGPCGAYQRLLSNSMAAFPLHYTVTNVASLPTANLSLGSEILYIFRNMISIDKCMLTV